MSVNWVGQYSLNVLMRTIILFLTVAVITYDRDHIVLVARDGNRSWTLSFDVYGLVCLFVPRYAQLNFGYCRSMRRLWSGRWWGKSRRRQTGENSWTFRAACREMVSQPWAALKLRLATCIGWARVCLYCRQLLLEYRNFSLVLGLRYILLTSKCIIFLSKCIMFMLQLIEHLLQCSCSLMML